MKVEMTTNDCTNTHSKSKTFSQQKFGKKRETNRGRKIREIKKWKSETEKVRERQRVRETERKTERKTETERERERENERKLGER